MTITVQFNAIIKGLKMASLIIKNVITGRYFTFAVIQNLAQYREVIKTKHIGSQTKLDKNKENNKDM